jgi:hypothetical protein
MPAACVEWLQYGARREQEAGTPPMVYAVYELSTHVAEPSMMWQWRVPDKTDHHGLVGAGGGGEGEGGGGSVVSTGVVDAQMTQPPKVTE